MILIERRQRSHRSLGWNRAAVLPGISRSGRLRVGEPTAAHDALRTLRPIAGVVLDGATAHRCRRRGHGGGAGTPGCDGLRRVGRCPGQRRALRAAAARPGVRGLRVRTAGGRRAGGHHRAARRNHDRAAGGDREHEVRRTDGDARLAGGCRVLRCPARSAGLDRRLLLAGGAGRVHHRGRHRADPRSARQAGRRLQRRVRSHPQDGRHRAAPRRRQRDHDRGREPWLWRSSWSAAKINARIPGALVARRPRHRGVVGACT